VVIYCARLKLYPECRSAASNAKRSSLLETLKNSFGYALASLLTGYYLLATAAIQLAPVAEVALLLSTPTAFRSQTTWNPR